MVTFPIPASVHPMVRLVGGHGMTDALSARRAVCSLGALAVPLPGPLTTALFAAASVHHISRDVGVRASVALHAAITVVALRRYEVAWVLMSLFLVCVHVPKHYRRVAEESGAVRALLWGGVGTLASFACDVEHLTHLHQRIVVAHVLAHDGKIFAPR